MSKTKKNHKNVNQKIYNYIFSNKKKSIKKQVRKKKR